MAASNPQQMYSMQIANSVGCPTRAQLLVVEEYEHWKSKNGEIFTWKRER